MRQEGITRSEFNLLCPCYENTLRISAAREGGTLHNFTSLRSSRNDCLGNFPTCDAVHRIVSWYTGKWKQQCVSRYTHLLKVSLFFAESWCHCATCITHQTEKCSKRTVFIPLSLSLCLLLVSVDESPDCCF